MLYRCHDCDALVCADELTYYQLPGARWCTGWDLDHENDPTCPYCGSFDIEEESEDDEDDEDD